MLRSLGSDLFAEGKLMNEMLQFRYLAQRFRPRKKDDEQLLLFVAPASEIRNWAGVPRKAFDFQHGFQRTLDPNRVTQVVDFFREDPKNISPTSIVVGLSSSVQIKKISAGVPSSDLMEWVEISISMPNLELASIEELTVLALNALRHRIPKAEISQIEADVASAIAEATRLQDENIVESDDAVLEQDMSLAASERSYLADFYAQLLGYQQKLVPYPANEEELRETLYSQLKPAVLVDGQHRVFGAATIEGGMLFSVCAMTATSWPENVYQFVVINQKAKPIKPAFLSAIIATSLTSDEIASVYHRLSASKVDVERAELMELLNTDKKSPFKGMIDFEVAGSPGFLQFPGMTRLLSDFKNIPNSRSNLLPDGEWNGKTGPWLDHFFAFWRGVREYFEPMDARLWREPSQDNPNNLMKIVTLQEVQGLMLDTWADSRLVALTTPEQTESSAKNFWKDFPATFFTDEWRQKGLQTSVGRKILRDAITETRRNTGKKNWGHRRLGLFSD